MAPNAVMEARFRSDIAECFATISIVKYEYGLFCSLLNLPQKYHCIIEPFSLPYITVYQHIILDILRPAQNFV